MSETTQITDGVNDICRDCLFWKKFKEECYVYWYKKKFCTMRVSDSKEFEEAKNLYNIPSKNTEK